MSEAHDRNHWNLAARGDYMKAITGQSDPVIYDARGEYDAHRLIDLIPECADLAVLEWGCGAGRVTTYLDALFKHVVAVDISQGMIERAKALHLFRTEFHVITGNRLPIADQSVDVVYSYLCWTHLHSKEALAAVLGECKRVLTPAGRLVFQLPLYEAARDRHAAAPGDVACWTETELRGLLEAAGLETVSLHGNPGAFDPAVPGPHHFAYHEAKVKD